jgi:hypothetical protein
MGYMGCMEIAFNKYMENTLYDLIYGWKFEWSDDIVQRSVAPNLTKKFGNGYRK